MTSCQLEPSSIQTFHIQHCSILTSFSDKQVKLLGEQCLLSTNKNQQPREATTHSQQRILSAFATATQHKGYTQHTCKNANLPALGFVRLPRSVTQPNQLQAKQALWSLHEPILYYPFAVTKHFAQTATRINQLVLHPTLCLHGRPSINCCPVTHVSDNSATFYLSTPPRPRFSSNHRQWRTHIAAILHIHTQCWTPFPLWFKANFLNKQMPPSVLQLQTAPPTLGSAQIDSPFPCH